MKERLDRCDFIDCISRPLPSASRYFLMASGPATIRGLLSAPRSSALKYSIDLKVVSADSSSLWKVASLDEPPCSATARALFVVPKSIPIAFLILQQSLEMKRPGFKTAERCKSLQFSPSCIFYILGERNLHLRVELPVTVARGLDRDPALLALERLTRFAVSGIGGVSS